MPLWTCDVNSCGKPAVRHVGECVLCNHHLCAEHSQHQHHKCPQWKDADAYDTAAFKSEEIELTDLIDKIDSRALASRASSLRRGVPCTIPPLQYDRATRNSVMGGMNYHIHLNFEDGVTWIARVRRCNATSPPPELQDYITKSEVATLLFLEHTTVPSPKVYDYAFKNDPGNTVGVSFILMDKLPGEYLKWSITTPEQRRKVIEQIADMTIELLKCPLNSLGSFDTPGSSHIGPLAREVLANFTQSKMVTIGPFSSSREYYISSIKFVMDLIIQDEIYSQRPVDAYLIYRFFIDLVPHMLPPTQDNTFYLKHADDKGDHILVDEDYNITGIIDWEWAHTASPLYAFSSPLAFLAVDRLFNGNNELSEDEIIFADLLEAKDEQDLARYARNGRLYQRFAICFGYDLTDWDGFVGLFRGLRDAAGVDGGLEWDEWKAIAMKRYENDAGLQQILSRHGIEALAES